MQSVLGKIRKQGFGIAKMFAFTVEDIDVPNGGFESHDRRCGFEGVGEVSF